MAGNSTSSANSWTERSASTEPSARVINFFEKLINTEGHRRPGLRGSVSRCCRRHRPDRTVWPWARTVRCRSP